jgi:hypothetical protein
MKQNLEGLISDFREYYGKFEDDIRQLKGYEDVLEFQKFLKEKYAPLCKKLYKKEKRRYLFPTIDAMKLTSLPLFYHKEFPGKRKPLFDGDVAWYAPFIMGGIVATFNVILGALMIFGIGGLQIGVKKLHDKETTEYNFMFACSRSCLPSIKDEDVLKIYDGVHDMLVQTKDLNEDLAEAFIKMSENLENIDKYDALMYYDASEELLKNFK